MRFMGHNVLAIIVAALAIYAIEYVIFAELISAEQYMAFTGITAEQVEGGMARMPFGIIPPVFAAIGLSLVIKWRNAAGWMAGLMTGLILAVLFAFGTSLYGYVYGPHSEAYLPVNLAHFLVCWGAAGAILGVWK
ncbi:MAG TPA: hypothetical protein VEA80_13000 [Vitreimonas sp.]|uniref:hypothetical protein n=1 Tax=Vitreimonas sp. TaxID=3069702 RepID=UPI002D6C31CC|nr:hypothetical protein [Vitreimonas sp.]HYD88386.1 hypothetical protein [Vitreimonas sp.]